MASIRCAHCKATHTSVAEVRMCAGQRVPALAAATQARGPFYPWQVEEHRWDAEQQRREHAEDDRVAAYKAERDIVLARQESVHGWAAVNELRDRVKALLVRAERGKRVGYFALLTEDGGAEKVKFYRVRTGSARGKWANNLFVDAQASDDFYPVRHKEALTAVLEGILADPEGAGLLYATELGRCCRCRRTLTDETSRERGIGPECFKKI